MELEPVVEVLLGELFDAGDVLGGQIAQQLNLDGA